ncbi:MAG: bifunctional acetate--CoA ligase family protein/GNAT family N-acetyltransferase [Verrucomicrobiales bacterium]|nr:bifunctional acetate--CoA ligase family protein/GNAT family N-acetyltransferase [Verrucomicrobiales bacterium]
MKQSSLLPLFSPASVAVFGASDRGSSIGGRVVRNLQESGFAGEIFPVNPHHEKVQGVSCYPDIATIKERVDLAVLATPAESVVELLEQCGAAGVRMAVILSAGFAEAGVGGKERQSVLLETARRHRIRLLGPNCLGVIRPAVGLNATFGVTGARCGDVALISQSGALCTAILDWAESEEIGFSAVVSTGTAADLDFGELLHFLALDGKTRSILLYIEGVNRSRSFLSGLRAAARLKPVVIMKSGRHAAGVKAAVSHTAAIVGGDDVFNAAVDRAGAVRVDSVGELFAAARILSNYRTTKGAALAIVTNAGGIGVIAADCATDGGIELPELNPETLSSLNESLPRWWSHGNPLDVLGDADVERYRAAIQGCVADERVDAVLVMLTPQATTDSTGIAKMVIEEASQVKKPFFGCWMGGDHVAEGRMLLAEAQIPVFRTPEAAVAAFSHLLEYRRNQKLLLEVPGPLSDRAEPDLSRAKEIFETVRSGGRRQLTPSEANQVLAAFHVPVLPMIEAATAGAAVAAADELGYPVAMKINSSTLTHKSEVGGVLLDLREADEVERAFCSLRDRIGKDYPEVIFDGVIIERMHAFQGSRELFIGVISDPVFGPAISFGAGGITVEVLRDQATALPPLNEVLIEEMISQTRISALLGEFRTMPPVKPGALVEVLLRVSQMVVELPGIAEMDINPLIANAEGVLALDARILLSGAASGSGHSDYMAIAPYPAHLARTFQLANREEVVIRPIRPEDAKIVQNFVGKLSEETKYFRFMQSLGELSIETLVRFTQIDYDREMAFLAVFFDEGVETEIGVARYTTNIDDRSCEFAVVVADAWQGRGVATALMHALMEEARSKGLVWIEGEVLSYNRHMLDLVKRLGFEITSHPDDTTVRVIRRRL